ncbi:MAG: HD domain-containing protein [Peptostreptococcaceae bacterium]|nr:HD domain-containing protein [Peptostreptococcaceae bacterium]
MDLLKDLDFTIELEKMKKVYRRTRVMGEERNENDAEHSWHISVMAMFLWKYMDEGIRSEIDIDKVLKMLLIHDIVEIYVGDTFAYDASGNEDKHDRELRAMEKIKSQLSEENAELVSQLWEEFEEMKSADALFANAMDRLQPIMNNIRSETGGTWREFGVTKAQLLKRMEPISKVSEELYAYLLDKVEENIQKGNILH